MRKGLSLREYLYAFCENSKVISSDLLTYNHIFLYDDKNSSDMTTATLERERRPLLKETCGVLTSTQSPATETEPHSYEYGLAVSLNITHGKGVRGRCLDDGRYIKWHGEVIDMRVPFEGTMTTVSLIESQDASTTFFLGFSGEINGEQYFHELTRITGSDLEERQEDGTHTSITNDKKRQQVRKMLENMREVPPRKVDVYPYQETQTPEQIERDQKASIAKLSAEKEA